MNGHGGDRRSEAFKSAPGHETARPIPRQRLAEFTRMARFANEPEVIEAVEAGASRNAVLRACNRAEHRLILAEAERLFGEEDGTDG